MLFFSIMLTINQGEIFKQTKERLAKRIGCKGKTFEKIKFAVVPRASFPNAKYIEDGESNVPGIELPVNVFANCGSSSAL